ncbi:unnamed protein product [Pleuronectes platessa]|uniref:MADF domain-containing protein n=1 Tax=Pleuronectes platessa TaxID=8262 RepID=A0A9N7YJM5_PLEPL|nr:unnamed protein product [Pleuronectes platessa]
MDQIEERLAEEVRKYNHLYNPSLTEYRTRRDQEISANFGLHADECTKLWRKIRDKLVRQKKAMRSSSGDVNKQTTTTAIHKEGVSKVVFDKKRLDLVTSNLNEGPLRRSHYTSTSDICLDSKC